MQHTPGGRSQELGEDRCRPYSINDFTLLGETHSSGVDKHLETKVLDIGSVKMKGETKRLTNVGHQLP